ncbi:MAG: TetR/AcrR family transcriptional regulator [Actinobacteria bacterium]|nr:TetR/AcrR family transcriptional regulator [Actinomycetota bacterium]
MTATADSTDGSDEQRSEAVARRRREILEATCETLSRKGVSATRIADVARRLGISTGLVHYHFATKDELLAEAFQFAGKAELEVLRELAAVDLPPRRRLNAVIEEFCPRGEFVSWRLWIEGWAEALRSERFRATSRELDEAWIGVLEDTITAGVASGDFICPSPHDSAWRLSCLIEGLAIQLVAHGGTIDSVEMARLVDAAVSAEVSGG